LDAELVLHAVHVLDGVPVTAALRTLGVSGHPAVAAAVTGGRVVFLSDGGAVGDACGVKCLDCASARVRAATEGNHHRGLVRIVGAVNESAKEIRAE